jgi:hypothetical protein
VWLLEKIYFDYSKDQVVAILEIIYKYNPLFILKKDQELIVKIDQHLKKFIKI